MTDEMYEQLTPYLVGARPNTYTFTKAVAESMIFDDEEANQHLPVIMVRPSIVTGIWLEPIPGWIDNANGATGLIALAGKGLLRSMCGDMVRHRADLVPVDIVANTLIVAAWHRGSAKGTPLSVIHCTTGNLNPTSWSQVIYTTIHNFTYEVPLVDLYRIPGGRVTPNRFEHRLRLFFDHLIPSYAIDFVTRLRGQRPRMVRVYEKILKVLDALSYFYNRTWDFDSNAIQILNQQLSDEDSRVFYIDVKKIDWPNYYLNYHAGVRKHIFKEEPSTIPKAKKIQFRRRLLANTIYLSFLMFFFFDDLELDFLKKFSGESIIFFFGREGIEI